uniref:Uncharacterized protein n=2 Tax=Anguilla anguilla TaxID=7936 RepID=A0A0E9VYP9_ANGAN
MDKRSEGEMVNQRKSIEIIYIYICHKKMLYNRAAYTLYIKAYIKYKNKTSNAFLPLLAA